MENLTINGRYRILQQIGVGGFGLTYLAEDLHLPTRPRCVVKHLKPQINDAETMNLANRLFQQEAEILYRLGGHPNIPSLIAHFKENGEFYLVQEYIEGHTIAQEFANGRKYYQKEVIQLLGQTLEILSFVHKQNVIHRDVKPSNLIRRASDGSIFLIDFGAVKQVSAVPRTQHASTFSTLTIGSHGYMPMEQMAGNPNFSSDLYALGLVVIEALIGTKPLDLQKNQNTNEYVWKHRAQVSPEVEHFISKLVRYDFRQRFYSASEALGSLNVIAGRNGFFQARNSIRIAPIVPNNNVISSITLSPQANVPSTPTLVPALNNSPDSYLPPTVIVSADSPNGLHPRQNFEPPVVIDVNNSAANGFKSWSTGSKVAIFVCVLLMFVGGLVIAAKSVINNFQPPEIAEKKQPPPRDNSEDKNQETVNTFSKNSPLLFYEAEKQAEEAEKKERNAKTKFEWEEISKQYTRAYRLLSTIDRESQDYFKAQEKITLYSQKAEFAHQRSLTAPETPNLDTSSDYKSSQTTPTSSPTPFPSSVSNKKPNVNLTMPPKQSAQNYLAYNYFDGYDVRQYSTNSNEALFTSAIEKYSYDTKDSKAVVIEIRGGSLNTEIKFKPPAYTQKLTAGNYPSVQEISYEVRMNYAIGFRALSCSSNANHSFRINNIIYNDLYNNVSLLDATFVLICGNRKLMGRIHYDAR